MYYALKLLGEAYYIDKCVYTSADGQWHFDATNEVTFAGHQFFETIKSPTIWEKTREASRKAGTASVSFIAQVASGFISSLASSIISNGN